MLNSELSNKLPVIELGIEFDMLLLPGGGFGTKYMVNLLEGLLVF